MASTYSAVKCANCGRSAISDFYYKTDEEYICCRRCGYHYSKTCKYDSANKKDYFEEVEHKGYGVISMVKKDGTRRMLLFNKKISSEDIENNKKLLLAENVDQDKSYFVSFEEGVFTILFGNPSENYHLTFEEYKENNF
ncbi:hypothetical protein [Fictibacillus barbaricus]|uniref:Uncharacterized protein n=1 Tax=Fictibacillus barbaricus TaxID=182136 RepID=A0ABU1U3G3_9BACL|nr:hypothetical protein [Fictibacillus barbaricus]MDR7074035.1 hypothetical protein [Fictibacillus barbaricus]